MDIESDFDTFVRLRGRSLLQAAWLLAGDWGSAQDLVQSALERVWPRWASLAGRDYAEAYVRRVIMTSFLRDRTRKWSAEVPSASPPDMPDPDASDGTEYRASLRAALLKLPPRQRAVVVWRYFADLTEAQTAHAMGCRVGTVKSYNARALATLRAHPDLVDLYDKGSMT
jgi:RNA polymerase sigma-70 factor (sigma-E family)